ncbi:hypothetical protein HDU86_007008 [Geranomyces michiganensis]|nr:hypothetical protein HDU86_007008 [Geranomyces michiganensis]
MRTHLRAFAAQCDPGDINGVETLEHVDAAVIDMDGADEERDEFARELATEHTAAAAESHAANAGLHWHRAADNAEARNPWVTDEEGKVMRFTELPCANSDVRAARLGEYHSIIAALEAHDAASALDLPEVRNEQHFHLAPLPRIPLANLDEHTRFQLRKLVEEYGGVDAANRGALCTHRIGLEITKLDAADISIYTRTLTTRAHRKNQHAARRRTLTALLATHLADTPAIFAAADCAVWRAGIALEETQREDMAAEARHASVAAWRLAQAAKKEEEEEEAKWAEAERIKEARLAAERLEVARQAHAREIAEYHAERQSVLLEQMTKAAELRDAYANHAIKRSKHNIARIRHRDNLTVQKYLAAAAEQERLEHERAVQAARLVNLARQVRPEVEADEERAHAETESWRSAKLAAAAQAERDESGRTWRVHGWTAAEVMRDSR